MSLELFNSRLQEPWDLGRDIRAAEMVEVIGVIIRQMQTSAIPRLAPRAIASVAQLHNDGLSRPYTSSTKKWHVWTASLTSPQSPCPLAMPWAAAAAVVVLPASAGGRVRY
jgi:hypothetical protein